MKFGNKPLKNGDKGKDVVELQLRLAGFSGTDWDGHFGANTKKQVVQFQKDFMKMATPTGIVDNTTFTALDTFANQFPIDFNQLKCKSRTNDGNEFCTCNGFGQERYNKIYTKVSKPRDLDWSRTGLKKMRERRHQYEYAGIHKAVLHTYRAFLFYADPTIFISPTITSGYRCHINNAYNSTYRGSTNHMGKALDFTFKVKSSIKKKICNDARALLVEKCNCQIRWDVLNKKALEPGHPGRGKEHTAPTWVHLDVREYEPDKYLLHHFFVVNAEELDAKELLG